MMHTIEVSEEVHERLQALAGKLFTVSEVVGRLVQAVEPAYESGSLPFRPEPGEASLPARRLGLVNMRAPRSRGATVEVDGQRMHAGTVPDLYQQVLRYLLNHDHFEKLKAILPYATSNQRFLISREPKHPNGNEFVVPVKVGGYYMEAHKNYDTALKQLGELLAKVDVDFRYLG